MKRTTRKEAFVLSVIGDRGSAPRRRANAVLRRIIRPALSLNNLAYVARRIDEKGEVGDITEAIIEALLRADLVIADLTDLNPNVMYEMGITQAWNVPLIPLIHVSQLDRLPFDIKVLSTVPYELTTAAEVQRARVRVRKQLRNILRGEQRDSVFCRALAKVGGAYSMAGVYTAFRDSLGDLDDSLFQYRHEIPKAMASGDEEGIAELSHGLNRAFGRLSDKLHVFEEIARGRVSRNSECDEEFLRWIDETRSVQKKANKIDMLLGNPRSCKRNRRAIDNLLGSAIKVVRKVAKNIPHQ